MGLFKHLNEEMHKESASVTNFCLLFLTLQIKFAGSVKMLAICVKHSRELVDIFSCLLGS